MYHRETVLDHEKYHYRNISYHCVKSVRRRSYSGLYFPAIGPE